ESSALLPACVVACWMSRKPNAMGDPPATSRQAGSFPGWANCTKQRSRPTALSALEVTDGPFDADHQPPITLVRPLGPRGTGYRVGRRCFRAAAGPAFSR